MMLKNNALDFKLWIALLINNSYQITLTPYMVLPLFATRFADYTGASESLSYSHVSFNLM